MGSKRAILELGEWEEFDLSIIVLIISDVEIANSGWS